MLCFCQSFYKRFICKCCAALVNQALEPVFTCVSVTKCRKEVTVCLPFSTITKRYSFDSLLFEVFGSFLNIFPCWWELIVSSLFPHCFVIDNYCTGTACQYREAVNLVAIFEWCKVILIILIIIWRSFNGICQVHDQSLLSPCLCIHTLKKEYIRKVVSCCKSSNMCFVFCVCKNVLV